MHSAEHELHACFHGVWLRIPGLHWLRWPGMIALVLLFDVVVGSRGQEANAGGDQPGPHRCHRSDPCWASCSSLAWCAQLLSMGRLRGTWKKLGSAGVAKVGGALCRLPVLCARRRECVAARFPVLHHLHDIDSIDSKSFPSPARGVSLTPFTPMAPFSLSSFRCATSRRTQWVAFVVNVGV